MHSTEQIMKRLGSINQDEHFDFEFKLFLIELFCDIRDNLEQIATVIKYKERG